MDIYGVLNILLSYFSNFTFFLFIHGFLMPKRTFRFCIISFFVSIVLCCGSLSIFVFKETNIEYKLLFTLPTLFFYTKLCYNNSLPTRVFSIIGAFCASIISELFSFFFIILLTEEYIVVLDGRSEIFLLFSLFACFANFLFNLLLLLFLRKYNAIQIHFTKLFISVFCWLFLLGIAILFSLMMPIDFNNIYLVILLLILSLPLLHYNLYKLKQIYENRKEEIYANEMEKQYMLMLDEYMKIRDSSLLQKYLRHDLLNHMQTMQYLEDKEQNLHNINVTSKEGGSI